MMQAVAEIAAEGEPAGDKLESNSFSSRLVLLCIGVPGYRFTHYFFHKISKSGWSKVD
jgi:hypothetical protein